MCMPTLSNISILSAWKFLQRLPKPGQWLNVLLHQRSTTKKKVTYVFPRNSPSFSSSAVQITLISANKDHLVNCKEDILELSRTACITRSLTDKQDMIDWPQSTIHEYYIYCLKQNVIPTLDFDKCTVELVGLKDAVIARLHSVVSENNFFRSMKPKNISSNSPLKHSDKLVFTQSLEVLSGRRK